MFISRTGDHDGGADEGAPADARVGRVLAQVEPGVPGEGAQRGRRAVQDQGAVRPRRQAARCNRTTYLRCISLHCYVIFPDAWRESCLPN